MSTTEGADPNYSSVLWEDCGCSAAWPLVYCTGRVTIGVQFYVIMFLVLSQCVSDIVLAWVFFSSAEACVDGAGRMLKPAAEMPSDNDCTPTSVPAQALTSTRVPPHTIMAVPVEIAAAPHRVDGMFVLFQSRHPPSDVTVLALLASDFKE